MGECAALRAQSSIRSQSLTAQIGSVGCGSGERKTVTSKRRQDEMSAGLPRATRRVFVCGVWRAGRVWGRGRKIQPSTVQSHAAEPLLTLGLGVPVPARPGIPEATLPSPTPPPLLPHKLPPNAAPHPTFTPPPPAPYQRRAAAPAAAAGEESRRACTTRIPPSSAAAPLPFQTPRAAQCSRSVLKNGVRRSVAESQTSARCLRARVAATLSRR
eukprot:scaffold24983_cov107-Isochrysis_galbana.AAC.1